MTPSRFSPFFVPSHLSFCLLNHCSPSHLPFCGDKPFVLDNIIGHQLGPQELLLVIVDHLDHLVDTYHLVVLSTRWLYHTNVSCAYHQTHFEELEDMDLFLISFRCIQSFPKYPYRKVSSEHVIQQTFRKQSIWDFWTYFLIGINPPISE